MPDVDASELVALMRAVAQTRDRAAFRRLYVALAPAVKGLARRQGADPAAAEELAQETFLTVWRNAALYSPERGEVRAWIYRIARNLRIDRLRRAAPWQELTDEHMQAPTDEPGPEENLGARQIQTRVRAVMQTLPPEQAEVVALAFFDGLSHSQIAARLGTPLGTVKTRMTLAYAKLRTALRELQ